MSRIPITKKQATELIKSLPVNRSVAASAARAGGSAVARRLTPSVLRAPTLPGGVEPLPVESKVGANYDTDWARSYPARAARVLLVEGVVKPAMRPAGHADGEGPRPPRGPRRPAGRVRRQPPQPRRHAAAARRSIPEPWRHHLFIGAAADYFFGNRVTATLSALVIGAIPIERTKVTRNSADQAAELLDDGWSMLIFPEGGRSPDGWGQAFRGGAAYLSLRCEVPVVPVHVEGTGRVLRKGKNVPRPSPTTVTFGTPLRAARGRGLPQARRPHRARRGRAGRRGLLRLVAGQAPRRRRRDAVAAGPGRRRLAPHLGPRRPQGRPPPPQAHLARAVART